MRRHRPLALALLLDLLGAGAALLVSIQTWQRLSATREGPFPAVRVDLVGREVEPAITALALVALAGVVAILATKGRWRRVVGAVVAVAGAGIVWRVAGAFAPVSRRRGLDALADKRETFNPGAAGRVDVTTLPAWPSLTVACGVLVLLAGLLVAIRGGRWEGMSARYDPAAAVTSVPRVADPAAAAENPDESGERARAAAAMWSALDRGEDPTRNSGPPSGTGEPGPARDPRAP